jgi:hypothetical protein
VTIHDKGSEYITLREAADISGYAPDYVGQLIRKGKLPGKQVYSNVAWVTTEVALKEYMRVAEEARKARPWVKKGNKFSQFIQKYRTRMASEFEAIKLYRAALYGIIVFSVTLSFLLFFIFSVSLDAWMTRRSTERIEKVDSIELLPPSEYRAVL